MESNNIGADEAARRERRIVEKRAIFDEVYKQIDQQGIEPVSLQEAMRIAYEGRRKHREEEERGQKDVPDSAG